MNDLINRLLLAAENRPDIRPLLQEAANEIASLKSRIEIRASLPEAPAVPVVKALKWTDHPAGGKQALAAGLGLYRVHANGDDWYLVPDHMGKGGKAAAQADFEARIRAVLATPPAPTAAVDGEVKPTERNKLVIDAYRAMDAIDAIRKWCDEQKYGNNTITVSRLRDMLPAVIRGRPQQFNVNTLVKKLRSQWGFGPSARSTLPIEWQQALDEAADAIAALSPGTADRVHPDQTSPMTVGPEEFFDEGDSVNMALQNMLRLFDEQGNMVADFAQVQEAVEGGYLILSKKVQP